MIPIIYTLMPTLLIDFCYEVIFTTVNYLIGYYSLQYNSKEFQHVQTGCFHLISKDVRFLFLFVCYPHQPLEAWFIQTMNRKQGTEECRGKSRHFHYLFFKQKQQTIHS